MHYNMLCINSAPLIHIVRQIGLIKKTPLKIGNAPTVAAYRVVMARDIRFKPALALDGFHLGNQPVLRKSGQGPINGIERQSGQTLLQTPMKRFGGRMIYCLGKLPIYLQPLVGDFKADRSTCLFKIPHLLIYRLQS